MQLKRNIAIILFTLSAVLILSPFYHCNQYGNAHYHDFLKSENFGKMTRREQILKCASCHKQEYDNELKGPHANAYKMLLQHKSFVNSDLYKCSFWTRHVNNHFEDCMACHTPKDLFQTFLYDSLHDEDAFVKKILLNTSPHLQKREDTSSRITSIDCMNCHFDGSNMVTLKGIAMNDSNPKNLTVAAIAKNNLVCYPCHYFEVNTMSSALLVSRPGSANCGSCHLEYNKEGKGTHYYYWRHDPPDKVNKTLLQLMDDFHFQLLPDNKTGEITWRNTTIPHEMSPIIELILNCEVLDKDSNVLGKKLIRINKKSEYDTLAYESLGKNYLPGVQGDKVSLQGTPVKYTFPIKGNKQADFFKISLIQKAQYWFPDSLGALTATKIYIINK